MLKNKVVERFLKYVSYDTQSNEDSQTVPSTSKQLDFAKVLAEELQDIGLSDISLDDNGYIMATLKSNCDNNIPTVGFIAHMDTSPDMPDENVKPKIVENYNGQDIILDRENNVILSPTDFPELLDCMGKSLITTDGTTLLGADDKAGIAEIVTAVEYLINHPEIPHGEIRVGFTPDEEIGCGADHFNVQKFNAEYAYTVDGGALGELECENFNAAGAKIKINGRNVHPGSAKKKMINSMFIANEFINSLPKFDVPENTEGYEGFFHLLSINGEVECTTLSYIIRDFDKESFEARKKLIQDLAAFLNMKYGAGTIEIELKDQYFNMKEKIEPVKYVVDNAKKAMETVGVTPIITPIRGGTDGARLSFMGLPTPNLFTGGYNFHGKYEFIPMESMEKAVEVILQIIKDVVEFK